MTDRKCKLHRGRDFYLFCSRMCPQSLERGLAPSKHSINVYRMNDLQRVCLFLIWLHSTLLCLPFNSIQRNVFAYLWTLCEERGPLGDTEVNKMRPPAFKRAASLGNRRIATSADDETKCAPWKGHRYQVLGGQRKRPSVLTEEGLGRPHGRGEAGALGSQEPRDGQGQALGQRATGGVSLPAPGAHCPRPDFPLLFPPIHPPPTPNNQNQTLLNPTCSGKICLQCTTLLLLNSAKSCCLSHILDCLLSCSLIVILMP